MELPTKAAAEQFALILACGAPPSEALRYFLPDDEEVSDVWVEETAKRWIKCAAVQAALKHLQGADWTELTPTQRIQMAVDKVYSQMAYYLYSRNYVELSGAERAKADTCRTTLEAKLAGTAGKGTPAEQFLARLLSGELKAGPSRLAGGPSSGPSSPQKGAGPSPSEAQQWDS